jgi:hypothetical protein
MASTPSSLKSPAPEVVTSSVNCLAVLQQSFVIGGWVAMWRPIEVFLYDWWPIRAEARLYDRLAARRDGGTDPIYERRELRSLAQ